MCYAMCAAIAASPNLVESLFDGLMNARGSIKRSVKPTSLAHAAFMFMS